MEETMLLQKIGEMISEQSARFDARFENLENRIGGIGAEIGELGQGQERLENRIGGIEAEISTLKQDMQEVCQEVRETRILVEAIPKQIQLIAEQHTDIIENQIAAEDYDEAKSRISTLEHVVKAHTKEIAEIRQAAI